MLNYHRMMLWGFEADIVIRVYDGADVPTTSPNAIQGSPRGNFKHIINVEIDGPRHVMPVRAASRRRDEHLPGLRREWCAGT
jgi:hypothetical protein